MRIAVSSQNWQTVTAHPGKSTRFLIFHTDDQGQPHPAGRLEFDHAHLLRCAPLADGHPLFDMDVILSASAGAELIHHLLVRGVHLLATPEKCPETAVRTFLNSL